jgi:hypothetical protein
MSTLFIRPAYGKQYHSQQQALNDWNAGKDFKIVNGPYLSNRDLPIIKRTYRYIVIFWQPNQQVALGV